MKISLNWKSSLLFSLLITAPGCLADENAGLATGADGASSVDGGVGLDSALATSDADSSAPLTPSDYCETVAGSYCEYYLRCDRMAVPDLAACEVAFAEVCGAIYEPLYISLAERGLLSLSREGVEACRDQLKTVSCEKQRSDLDGACGRMWVGLTPAGGPCSYGIEALVCDESTTCVLAPDFCGTCEPAVALGDECGQELGVRCHREAACVEGRCVARAAASEACSDAVPCLVGAECQGGVCVSYEIVGVGETCDRARRCQYMAACVAGRCQQAVPLGEPCGPMAPCAASGVCEGGVCVAAPPLAETGCLD